MLKRENTRVGNAVLRGEEDDSTKILGSAAMAEFSLLTGEMQLQLTLLNMQKDMHTRNDTLGEWDKKSS